MRRLNTRRRRRERRGRVKRGRFSGDCWSSRTCRSILKTTSIYWTITGANGRWKRRSAVYFHGTTKLSTSGRKCPSLTPVFFLRKLGIRPFLSICLCVTSADSCASDLSRHFVGFLIFGAMIVMTLMEGTELGGFLLANFSRYANLISGDLRIFEIKSDSKLLRMSNS